MKIGLFFGSFNPIHVGHLIIANTMAYTTDLEQVWLVVSPQNPFKKNKSLLHEFDRLTMVQKAISDNYRLQVSDIEFSMPKPSYTIDTLTRIQEKHPEHDFALIMGEDNLTQFQNWKNHDKILEYYSLYVYPRPNIGEHEFKNHPKIKWIAAPSLDISATFIRNAIKNKQPIKYMVADIVAEYIEWKGFYL